MITNTVTTIWKQGMQFESDNPSGHTISIDTNGDNGGNNMGLRPKAMMLSSLAGCSGLDIIPLLKKMRVIIDDFKIEVTGELTEEHPKFYHTVTVDYHFYGNDLQQSKINKAVKLSIEKYCGVMEMFRQFAKIKTTVNFHEK
ncbi:Osmotically inducible protein OsmC [Tenacibaculum maritimum]|uniref:OsmC-like protein n=1 Tax=Tenacibaculum maritimum NCIMB 2154 TaxID=1349785 RepID=A0A2H1ED75_9FLAO|nr:OsmC family protein [Tenacibaculum maritimum]SFZ84964.1 OsmC-like protein [Tenacibaculum maritimum NCIMB 2154]CAA0145859.1 Osmotically inducible protein OsmC [Tenacibaculum maritimum]CAA0150762.1 Osmotically inducible protein OsmC [Tenacibaculum maritimum]CAA0150798.1 Osmotically inducible protein OsmC [Tenacibaculum maritimum]CAA0157012.1 Osmotically inducible protein OsmC [Tenacibaculum maritimum]